MEDVCQTQLKGFAVKCRKDLEQSLTLNSSDSQEECCGVIVSLGTCCFPNDHISDFFLCMFMSHRNLFELCCFVHLSKNNGYLFSITLRQQRSISTCSTVCCNCCHACLPSLPCRKLKIPFP